MNSKYFLSTDDFKEVKNEVNKIKEFYDHLTLYILINIFLTIIIVTRSITDDGVSVLKSIMSFEAYSVWVFWGIGVFIHWFMVFVMPKLFSKKWEEEKMKQLFEKNKD